MSQLWGCVCLECLETYEADAWRPPFVCGDCVHAAARHAAHAAARAAYKAEKARWVDFDARMAATQQEEVA